MDFLDARIPMKPLNIEEATAKLTADAHNEMMYNGN